jgi:hypothetical protein
LNVYLSAKGKMAGFTFFYLKRQYSKI